MNNWKLNIVICLLAYVVFMLASVPADRVVARLSLPAGVTLGPISGSLWSGKAATVQIKQDVINDVSWQLNPLSLLFGGLSAQVKFGRSTNSQSISGHGQLSTDLSMTQFSAEDFILRYPATQLNSRMALNLPVQLGGQMVLNLDRFEPEKPYCETLEGVLSWKKARLNGMGSDIQLGKIDAELGCQKGQIEFIVKDKNPLGLQLKALLGANQQLSLKGFVKPSGDMPDEVHQAVKLLGGADSKGRFPINF